MFVFCLICHCELDLLSVAVCILWNLRIADILSWGLQFDFYLWLDIDVGLHASEGIYYQSTLGVFYELIYNKISILPQLTYLLL